MKTVVLISCVSQKLPHKVKAKDLYISPLFRMSLQYARSFNPDKVFILSAKHGLLDPDREIEPYNETLNTKSTAEIREWSAGVLRSLRKEIDLSSDRVVFLAGDKYRKLLLPHLGNYEIPMEGLTIGRQLQYLKEMTQG